MVAIGNGTASRETEQFVADILKEMPEEVYLYNRKRGRSKCLFCF